MDEGRIDENLCWLKATRMYILFVDTDAKSGVDMTYARVFQSGNSQAVRLPKEFRFDVEQVEIFRRGDEIILRAIPSTAEGIMDILAQLPNDFMATGREDPPSQKRESF